MGADTRHRWRETLDAFAAAYLGPDRARELHEEIARTADALERLSAESLDVREDRPDLAGVPGEERA